MIIHNKYLILDFETTGLDPKFNQPVSIGALMIDGRKLSICDRGTFYSLINIIGDDKVADHGLSVVEQKALDVNKLTLEEIGKAPPLKQVWREFTNWVNYHNPTKDKWDAPILCGHNVSYDSVISDRIRFGHLGGQIVLPTKLPSKTTISKMTQEERSKEFGALKALKEPWKFGPDNLFHPSYSLDTMALSIALFENIKEPTKFNLGAIKSFLGFNDVGAHNALVDVLYSGEILVRYLRLFREVIKQTEFAKNSISILGIEEYLNDSKI